jgi:thioredoxin-related protein
VLVLSDLFSKVFSLQSRVIFTSVFIITLMAGAIVYRSLPHDPPPAVEQIYWGKSLVATNEPSKREHKYVLADVYTDYCSWCKKLDHETFTDQAFVKYLKKDFICVKLNAADLDEGSKVAESFSINGFPCALVFSPDGELIGQVRGFKDATAYMAALVQIVHAHEHPVAAAQADGQAQWQAQPDAQKHSQALPDTKPQPAPGSP